MQFTGIIRRLTPALAAAFFLAPIHAGPVDFGLSEFRAALASRNLKTRIVYDLSPEAPESFRVEPYKAGGAHITGGDMRGLMYGLLEAADQIRTTGRMKQVHGVPATLVPARACSPAMPISTTPAGGRFSKT